MSVGHGRFGEGLREASAFQGISDFEEEREQLLDGRTRMVRAALGLVSGPDDPLLMWTSYPWPYINLHRVPATRYIWKNFLLGEIYLARSGPQYVLPGTWETFAADVERTDPTAFVVGGSEPGRARHAVRTLVDESFTTVFADDVADVGVPQRPGGVAGVATGRRGARRGGTSSSIRTRPGCSRIRAVFGSTVRS